MADNVRVLSRLFKHKKKMAKKDIIFNVFTIVFFALFFVITIYPFVYLLSRSFSGIDDIYRRHGFWLIPEEIIIDSYKDLIFNRDSIKWAAITTVSRTLLGTAISLAANALLAFILSRKKFLFKSGLSLFWIFTMYASAGILPVYFLYKKFHLVNSFWVYIIPGIVGVFHVLVMRTYMEGIPDSFEESAELEGAGYLRIFWRIVSPLCKPVYAVIAFFIAVSHWNSWFDALLYNRLSIKYTTLQYEVMKLLSTVMAQTTGGVSTTINSGNNKLTPDSMRAALAILTFLPVLILYPFFQKYFVSGLTIRGIKD